MRTSARLVCSRNTRLIEGGFREKLDVLAAVDDATEWNGVSSCGKFCAIDWAAEVPDVESCRSDSRLARFLRAYPTWRAAGEVRLYWPPPSSVTYVIDT